VDAREYERRSEAGGASRQNAQGGFGAAQRLEAAPQVREDLDGHSPANAAGVNELAVIGVEQQRPEMGPRSFRVAPADDDELLAVQPFRASG
jgi:hypothetical protein